MVGDVQYVQHVNMGNAANDHHTSTPAMEIPNLHQATSHDMVLIGGSYSLRHILDQIKSVLQRKIQDLGLLW